jgi:hypothetical protein
VPLDRVRLTAAKSGLGRHMKLCLARPQGSAPVSASEDDELRLARPQGSAPVSASEDDELRRPTPGLGLSLGSERRRTPPHPTPGLGLSLGSGRRRTPPHPTPGLGLDLDLGRQTRPRPRRILRLARPRTRTDHVTGGAIITLPLASSGYGEQDRRPIWLVPITNNDGAPRAP